MISLILILLKNDMSYNMLRLSDYLWNAEYNLLHNKAWTFDLHFHLLLQFIWKQFCHWIFKTLDFKNPPGTRADLGCESIFVVAVSPGEVVDSWCPLCGPWLSYTLEVEPKEQKTPAIRPHMLDGYLAATLEDCNLNNVKIIFWKVRAEAGNECLYWKLSHRHDTHLNYG